MEIRSIQRFGSGTHVISLPKKWTEKYKIEKGDKIVIIEKEHGILVLYPEKLKIDSASFSAHKIQGPRGIGILYTKNRPERPISPRPTTHIPMTVPPEKATINA